MSCNSIKDPVKKARCIEAQGLLKKHMASETAAHQKKTAATKITGTMHYGHGTSRDSITFKDVVISEGISNLVPSSKK